MEGSKVARLTRRRVHVQIGAMLASFAVAGCLVACSPVHPGAAATVGHTRISVAQVRAATKVSLAAQDLSAAPAPDSPDAERAALTTLIRNHLLADAAAAKQVTVSEGDVQDLLANLRKSTGSDENTAKNNNIPLASLHQVAYQGLLVNKLEAAVAPGQTDSTALSTALTNYLLTLAKQGGVTVSPRYGAWDPDPAQFGVVAADGFSTAGKAPIAVQSPIAAPAS